jgi:TetR/AcrR family transcriptional regulator, regulator of cefoperazone and chloramphenicol sensitivity
MRADPDDTKARVIAAASALFAERGFHGTTVRDIAQRARVNLAAGHYHFGSKATLYLEVLRAQFGDVMAELEQRGARLTGGRARPGRAALRELLRTRIAAMLELLLGPPPGPHGTLMMREMCDPSAALPEIVEQFIQPHKRELEAIVAALLPRLGRAQVERCVFSIVGQVFFYRQQLPALQLMNRRRELTRAWMHAAAEHIAAFSLGGMQQIAAGRGRPGAARRTR